MALSGALAGLAGAVEVAGLNYCHALGFSVGYGFDAIAVALLGRTHPLGVIPAALLFGALRAARPACSSWPGPDRHHLGVQALILLFVAADDWSAGCTVCGGGRAAGAHAAAGADEEPAGRRGGGWGSPAVAAIVAAVVPALDRHAQMAAPPIVASMLRTTARRSPRR